VLFVNFKTYAESTGANAIALAKLCEVVAKEKKVNIALVVQAIDLKEIARSVSLPVFAQHVDAVVFGANTGKILPEAVKQAGAVGTVINHAEFKQSNETIQKAVARCKELGLLVMACAETNQRAIELAAFAPDFIAVEPPELIGGNVSVSTAQPELVTSSVVAVKKINNKIEIITGAGVKSASDVLKAIELGTVGVFVASGIIKAKDQKAALLDLASGMKK
jgi:triosephosphate isomerase